jgi:acyl transferase domain-containing protein/SAM-dependent methyltransferase
LLLDGCFQAIAAARSQEGAAGRATYLPFGWQRLWLAGPLPERLICHVRMSGQTGGEIETGAAEEPPEVLTADLRIHDEHGTLIGELTGYLVKRATRAALLSAVEGVQDLLYEVVWRDRALAPGMPPADFLTAPSTIAAGAEPFTGYLAAEGVSAEGRAALLADLERLARCYALAALDKLGWRRSAGELVDVDRLRQRLQVGAEHERLFRRMLEMATHAGVLEEQDDGFLVRVDSGSPLPDGLPSDPEQYAAELASRHEHGLTEIGLFRRSGGALPDVLCGNADPLTLLFSSGEPSAADLYRKAPVARAANRMLADAVAALLRGLPEGRRLRVIEVGAGTGSATAAVLPELPAGRFDYVYTDISAGFFAEAEATFGGSEAAIEYRVLDIEDDPVAQGFAAHGYDLVIASNVLHATRYLHETLAHCGALLAPAGQLVALENLRGQGWLDLTFGQLDGWWRFADHYRPHHALASPAVWRRALGDSGFPDTAVLGLPPSDPAAQPDRGVIVAQGPAEVAERPGAWVLAADCNGSAARLAGELAARNQTVVLATGASGAGDAPSGDAAALGEAVTTVAVDMEQRDAWRALLETLPGGVPLAGVVHLAALDGHGIRATTTEMAQDTRRAAASALALVQGLADADLTPANGTWFVTRGAQVLEKERAGELAGATLWGIGKVIAREAVQLQPRMIDLDPDPTAPTADLAEELLYPDQENHVAYRAGRRQAARLVRAAAVERLPHPERGAWLLEPDPAGVLEGLRIDPWPARALQPREVRLAVEAAGLNFWDVFRAIGLVDTGLLGGEACGRILEVGSAVTEVEPGDLVVALAFGTFGSEVVTRVEMVAHAPAGIPVAELATMPTAFASALMSYDEAELQAGERVLIHAGAGGVGLAAIQLAQAAGAEVFATASTPKQAYLRALGVRHVYDSRSTAFGREILAATGGAGVDVVLNSLTGEGFIDASLSCLARGGRFVELARVDILSEEEMAAARPDVAYTILKLDVLKEHHPAVPGDALRRVMARLAAGELRPLVYSRWPLTEAGPAMDCMRAARHLGKIVLAASPLEHGRLRPGRTFLVTGGLGGIGCAVAGWLADRGAEAIVLNGRRAPDPEAEEAVAALRDRGVTVRVELADVTDAAAVDAMLARIDAELPPLGGVIHSVGVLADAALGNQSWQTFEQVLWPKMLGAWHLHRATEQRELDLFLLFSSIVGTMGNAGQANHAAANAFLDQLAAHRRARGLPGQAIAWGAWSGLGEAEEQRERIARQRSAFGGGWFTPHQGLRALDRLVLDDPATAAVMAMDWPVFAEAIESRPPLLEELLAAAVVAEADTADEADDLPARVRAAPAAEREGLLAAFLQREVQAVLRLPSVPAPEVGFFELGMDSLMAVELRNRLNRAFADAYTAPNTLVFDYPDVATLARHLATALGGDAAVPDAAAPPDGAAGGAASDAASDAAIDDAAPPGATTATVPPPASAPGPTTDTGPAAPAFPPLSAVAPAPVPVVVESQPRTGAVTADAVAIVGMACRFPGAPDLAAFARQIEEGRDAVTDRRPDVDPGDDVPGLPVIRNVAFRRGGFVTGIDQFDARFFSISPIEARMMDPRQRMLLEISWQALEDAAIDPETLRGSRAGVYVGVSASEYRDLMTAGNDIVSYLGTSASMTVGRISFLFGLEGPTMPVELNCASSLVAVHQAAAALHVGEVDVALVGGVHANLSPAIILELGELGLLSPTGQCAAFSAAADGFVRGEGCGLVVLKRLADARADGDRIWGVIRGSAVNQNGASAGPAIPNGPAQERVIAEALVRAGIEPADVDYLEAHGAGSSLGDAIEVQAAAAVYGRGRAADRPLLIGSAKASIGHLEPAAGIAGLIRAVLAIDRGVIPPHPQSGDPSPNVDWRRLPVRVATESVAWPASPGRPRRAGVSALGISGANAHVVLEGPDAAAAAARRAASVPVGSEQPVAARLPDWVAGDRPPATELAPRRTRLLPLSGKSSAARRALAEGYLLWLGERADELADSGVRQALLADMAWTAGVGRSHLPHRAAVVFHDLESLRAGLQALADADAETEAEPRSAARAAFAYSGQAGPWLASARALYECEPVVRAVLDRCEQALRDERGVSLLEAMFERPGATGELDRQGWMPAAVYALQCALTALWSSVGIRPAAVLGERIGELAAAHAAGMFAGVDDGLRLAASADGSAGGNDSTATAPPEVVLAAGTVPVVDAATGRIVGSGTSVSGERWHRPAGGPVAAGACLRTLTDLQIDAIVEIAPRALPGWPARGGTVPVIRARTDDAGRGNASNQPDGAFVAAVAAAYETGLPVSFAGLFAGEARRRISLPAYPFQRRRHWIRMR